MRMALSPYMAELCEGGHVQGRQVSAPPVSELYSSTQNLHRSVDRNSRSLDSPCSVTQLQYYLKCGLGFLSMPVNGHYYSVWQRPCPWSRGAHRWSEQLKRGYTTIDGHIHHSLHVDVFSCLYRALLLYHGQNVLTKGTNGCEIRGTGPPSAPQGTECVSQSSCISCTHTCHDRHAYIAPSGA